MHHFIFAEREFVREERGKRLFGFDAFVCRSDARIRTHLLVQAEKKVAGREII